MSNTGGPAGFEIAALRKKQEAMWNPMSPGPGTPWEDRGTGGTVGAFLKTCLASLTGPRKLADSIRRPETTADARGFVIGCGLLWGLSAAGHVFWALHHKANHPEMLDKKLDLHLDVGQFDTLWLAIDLLVALAGGAAGVVGLWMIFTAIYNRLAAQETRNVKLPEPLIANVAAYTFGPSLLAVIPVVGPLLGVLAMLAVMIAVGTSSRLRLRAAGAVINALLSFLVVVAIAAAGSGSCTPSATAAALGRADRGEEREPGEPAGHPAPERLMDRRAARLLARVRRRFATVTDVVSFGPVSLSFTRVADPNRVLDEVAAEEDRRERDTGRRHKEPLHLPYWAELWDSGNGVAAYLVHRFPVELAGRSVLDLGCGQGLPRVRGGHAGGARHVRRPGGAGPAVRTPQRRRHRPRRRRPPDQLADGRPGPAVRPDRRRRHPL